MSEQNEPTMEEILASIRRIISEEGDDKGESAGPTEPAPAPVPAPVAKPKPVAPPSEPVAKTTPLDQSAIDDVFDLTEVVEDEPIPEPDPWEIASVAASPVDNDEEEGLISPAAAAQASNQFNALSSLLTAGYPGDGRTLEQLVEHMLRPMLKGWLDENLPSLVERLVAQEIERLSRKR